MSEKVTIKVERKELHLPTIALRGLVVFPNNLVHFEVGREKSIAAVEWAMANNSNVFLVAQKEMETSEPTQQDLYTYGVVAEVKQVLRVSDELVKVLVEGKYRAKLTELDTTGDFLLSAVRSAPVRAAKPEEAVETEALLRALKTGFDEYLGMNPRLAKDVVFTIVSSDDGFVVNDPHQLTAAQMFQKLSNCKEEVKRTSLLQEVEMKGKIWGTFRMFRDGSRPIMINSEYDAFVDHHEFVYHGSNNPLAPILATDTADPKRAAVAVLLAPMKANDEIQQVCNRLFA